MRMRGTLVLVAAVSLIVMGPSVVVRAQGDDSAAGKRLYDDIRAFTIGRTSAAVSGLVLRQDRVELKFDGTFYFETPVNGRVTGAVFIGAGSFKADPPASDFERDNVRRLLNADSVETDFRTAVLRWTDNTLDNIDARRVDGAPVPEQARQLAAELEPRLLKETGVNLSARLAGSILHAEQPGVFYGQFDGGKRGRVNLLLDHQNRIPVANFNINGGEKGLIFAYQSVVFVTDVWMAFYSRQDEARGVAPYSDANDLVSVTRYEMAVDLTDLDHTMGLKAKLTMQSRAAGLRAIPFVIGESLSAFKQDRLQKQLRLKSVTMGGQSLSFVQEDWEGGFTVLLDQPAAAGQALTLDMEFAGDFMSDPIGEFYYPASNTAWFPRHGYLGRATFDLTFRHRKREKIASVGQRTSEAPDPADPNVVITKYVMPEPVSFAVFAAGPYDRHTQTLRWETGGAPIPLELNSVPARVVSSVSVDFLLAELDNALRYFAAMFGKYPYPAFGAALHPFGFGQGFPSLLMIPPADSADKSTYSFIAHETAHQWWGNIVAWRSYRDQWLSEGFAEYSGLLYTQLRDKRDADAGRKLIEAMRDRLRAPPRTLVGIGQGRLNDIGPIILGQRLNTSKTLGAYQALVYSKGALVLRMLHMLMTNPSTGEGQPFFTMMTDFVGRSRNRSASTEDFMKVAGEHFARTPIAQKYNLTDLNWFFRQWVYQSNLPSYSLEYAITDQPDGSVVVDGTVKQDGAPADWIMPLPIVFGFAGTQTARTTIIARGPSTTFQLKLPAHPKKVDLDPFSWVLSEKTSTKAK